MLSVSEICIKLFLVVLHKYNLIMVNLHSLMPNCVLNSYGNI